MPLPKIDMPLYELELPSNSQKIKYRPFTVKEEKILLIAQESKDRNQIILSIKQILENCIQGFDIDTLSVFDLEYVLMQIRARSVNNEFNFSIVDPESREQVELSFDIDEIKVVRSEKHKKIIQITKDIHLMMKYPNIDYMKYIGDEENTVDAFALMQNCVEGVVQGESVYKLKDFTAEEVEEFFDSLSAENLQKIKEFFETIPRMRIEKKYRLKDGTEKTFIAEGTETFFI